MPQHCRNLLQVKRFHLLEAMSVQKSFSNSLRSEDSPDSPSCVPVAEEEEGGSTLSFKQGAGRMSHLKSSTQASGGQEDIYVFQTKKDFSKQKTRALENQQLKHQIFFLSEVSEVP